MCPTICPFTCTFITHNPHREAASTQTPIDKQAGDLSPGRVANLDAKLLGTNRYPPPPRRSALRGDEHPAIEIGHL